MQLTDESFCVRENGVDVLDQLVGRKPAFRGAEIHGAARGDDADPDLACGLHLRLEQARATSREDVVVVEDRRAARERELGKAGARGSVLGLGVDPGPGRIELAQPAEEVSLLGAGTGECLVQVVVGVDKPRRDDGAAEVDALVGLGLRLGPRADGDDRAVLHEQPTGPVLVTDVVTRDDPTPGEQAPHACSGTSSKRSTSTRPRSVILRCGMTESPRNESVRNGVAPVHPSACAASLHARLWAITSANGASERSPAIGSGHSARTLPSSTATMPPPISASRSDGDGHVRVVHADDDDVVGVVGHGRCEGAACQPRPRDEAVADSPRGKVPLDDRDLREIASSVRDGEPVFDDGRRDHRGRHHLIRDQPDRADRLLVHRDLEVGRSDGPYAHGLPNPVGDLDRR